MSFVHFALPNTMDVYTWNMGYDNIAKKGANLVSAVKANPNVSDVLVFGFQEISVMGFHSMVVRLKAAFAEYTVVASEKTCTLSSGFKNSFVIATIIFVRSSKVMHARALPPYKDCKSITKGFVCIPIVINNKVVNIINTHLPFNNDLQYFVNLFAKMLGVVSTEETTIILGDLNSRSLILDECYKKNVQYQCDMNDCNLATQIKKLHTLPIDQTIKLPSTVRSIHLPDTKVCGIQKSTLQPGVQNDIFERFLKSMIQKDFLKLFLKRENTVATAQSQFMHITNDMELTKSLLELKRKLKCYCESKIDFFPTYKRDVASGVFSLSKKEKGRLPGYADRVIYSDPSKMLQSNTYMSLAIRGNDHLPVLQRFSIKNV